jgi:hypothetical protein
MPPENEREPYQGVPFELVPSKTILEETVRDQRAARSGAHHSACLGSHSRRSPHRRGLSFRGSFDRRPGDEARTVGTQAIVQLTDLGLVWKFNGADAWVYVFLAGERAAAGQRHDSLPNERNETVLSAKTSAAGIAYFHRDPRSRWLMAENGDDFQRIEFRSPSPDERPPLRLQNSLWLLGAAPRAACFPLFRSPPLSTGRIRSSQGHRAQLQRTGLILPQPVSFLLRLNNPDDDKVWEKQVALSPEGSFTADIALPDGRLGNYTAVAEFGQNNTRALSLEVQEYKPAPFEISLLAKDSYAADEVVRANVAAKYFHGKPLGKALLRWSIEGRDTGFHPDGFEQFTFGPAGDAGDEEEDAATKFAAHDETHLDADGTASIAPELTTNPAQPQPRPLQPARGSHRSRPDHDFRANPVR